jgi:hypothetical protein
VIRCVVVRIDKGVGVSNLKMCISHGYLETRNAQDGLERGSSTRIGPRVLHDNRIVVRFQP